MTTIEFARSLQHAIESEPDTDGEPGYWANVIAQAERPDGSVEMLVVIDDSESPHDGQRFKVTIERFSLKGSA